MMQQAPVCDGLSFDPFPFDEDCLAASEADIGRRQVAQALVVTKVIVVAEEGVNLGLEVTGQRVVFEQMRFFSVWCQRSILPWVMG